MGKRYILLISKEIGNFCYKGEGTEKQVKRDIEKLIKTVEPEDIEIIPVIGSRFDKGKFILACLSVLGLGLLGIKTYESLYKRIRERRREHTSS